MTALCRLKCCIPCPMFETCLLIVFYSVVFSFMNILCNQIRHFNILFYEKVLKELNTMKTDVYRCLNLINWLRRQKYSDYFLVYWKQQTMNFAQIYILYQLKAWLSFSRCICFPLNLWRQEKNPPYLMKKRNPFQVYIFCRSVKTFDYLSSKNDQRPNLVQCNICISPLSKGKISIFQSFASIAFKMKI